MTQRHRVAESLVAQRLRARADRAADVARFVQGNECRHRVLGIYLGGNPPRTCKQCDNCGVPLTRIFVSSASVLDANER